MGLIDHLVFRLLFLGDKAGYFRHKKARIGRGCDLLCGIYALGSEPWLIRIDDNVTVTSGCIFITHDGASRLFRDRPGHSRFGNRFAPIHIGSDSFIGMNSIIMPGVTVGPRSIIGAGSVVTSDVPPDVVYAGNPARMICTLDEYISRYESRMIPVKAKNKRELREELTKKLIG